MKIGEGFKLNGKDYVSAVADLNTCEGCVGQHSNLCDSLPNCKSVIFKENSSGSLIEYTLVIN